MLFLDKFQADGLGKGYGFSTIFQGTILGIDPKYLYLVFIAASTEQIFPVGGDDEVSWMGTCLLIPCFLKHATGRVDRKDRNAIPFQAIGSIEKTAVGGKMDVGTSCCRQRIGHDRLDR